MTQQPSDMKIVEAILLLADEQVTSGLVGQVLEKPKAEVEALLDALARSYEDADRGMVVRRVGGGWRLYTSPDCAPWLERFVTHSHHGRLTAAALEVLAIIAYRQPISRTDIAHVRGVDSDGVVRTLSQRGLVVEAGRDPGPGAPVLFKVSESFLERLGLASIAELPPLAGFMPDTAAVEDMEARLSPGA